MEGEIYDLFGICTIKALFLIVFYLKTEKYINTYKFICFFNTIVP